MRATHDAAPFTPPAAYPATAVFDEIDVVPYQHLLDWSDPETRRHVGGPIWPDWEGAGLARHAVRGRLADRPPAPPPPAPPPPERRDDGPDRWWIGPVQPHFGHQVAEFSARIAPTLEACPHAVLVVSAHAEKGPFDLAAAPPFLRDLLDWFEVPPERVLFVDRPTRFARLHVAAQGELLGDEPECAPHPGHLDPRAFAAAEAASLARWLREVAPIFLKADRRSRLMILGALLRLRPAGWPRAAARLILGPLRRRLRLSRPRPA